MNKEKTIFIVIYQGHQARNVLKTDIFKLLKEREDLRLVIFCKKIKADYYRQEYGGERVIIEGVELPKMQGLERKFFNLAAILVDSQTVKLRQLKLLDKERNHLKYLIRRLITKILGNCPPIKSLIRYFDFHFCLRKELLEYFDKHQPDLVFVPNILGRLDTAMVQAAKKRGVKSVGMVNSWDNLSSRGLMRAVPDKLIVHNETIKNEAIHFDGLRPANIFISGLPHFDYYVKEKRSSKEEFYRRINVPPDKEIILFCPIGPPSCTTEWQVLKQLHQAIKDGKITFKAHLLVRLPPNNQSMAGEINPDENLTVDRQGFRFLSGDLNDWEWTAKEMIHLADSLYFSKVLIGYASTMTIDAAAFDLPVINVAYEGWEKKKGIETYEWFYYHTTHYLPVIQSGALKLANNLEQLIDLINQYYHHPEQDREKRKKLLLEQTYKFDGRSGERLADYLIKNLSDD